MAVWIPLSLSDRPTTNASIGVELSQPGQMRVTWPVLWVGCPWVRCPPNLCPQGPEHDTPVQRTAWGHFSLGEDLQWHSLSLLTSLCFISTLLHTCDKFLCLPQAPRPCLCSMLVLVLPLHHHSEASFHLNTFVTCLIFSPLFIQSHQRSYHFSWESFQISVLHVPATHLGKFLLEYSVWGSQNPLLSRSTA